MNKTQSKILISHNYIKINQTWAIIICTKEVLLIKIQIIIMVKTIFQANKIWTWWLITSTHRCNWDREITKIAFKEEIYLNFLIFREFNLSQCYISNKLTVSRKWIILTMIKKKIWMVMIIIIISIIKRIIIITTIKMTILCKMKMKSIIITWQEKTWIINIWKMMICE